MSFFGPISSPVLDETATPLARRAFYHARVVGSFAVAQAIVQVIGFVSGILLVRSLDQREYAYFTIANTTQGTLNVLADIGISIGLMSIGGRIWQNRTRFGQLIVTGLQLRKILGLCAIVAITPILYFLLSRNGAPAHYSALLIVGVLAGLAVQLALGVLSVVPRLHSDLARIRTIDLTGAIARLLLILAFAYLFLNAGVAVAIGSVVLLVQFLILRPYVARMVDLKASANPEDRVAIVRLIKSQAANAIFFCVQGQLTVFLISFFAYRVGAVAEVGALGRLAMIFTVMSNLLANIFVPAFARCQSARKLRLIYAAIIGGICAFCIVVMAGARFFPDQFLFVLGRQYSHLHRELLLMVGSAILSALSGALWALNASRAWINGSWLNIPFTILTQIALIPVVDFGDVSSVLMFNIVSTIPSLLINIALSFRGFRSAQPAPVA